MTLNNYYKDNIRQVYLEFIEFAMISGVAKEEIIVILEEYIKILTKEYSKIIEIKDKENIIKQLVKSYNLSLKIQNSFEKKHTYESFFSLLFDTLSFKTFEKDNSNHIDFFRFCLYNYISTVHLFLKDEISKPKDEDILQLIENIFGLLTIHKNTVINTLRPDLLIELFYSLKIGFESSEEHTKKQIIKEYFSFYNNINLDNIVLCYENNKFLKQIIVDFYFQIIKLLTNENLKLETTNTYLKQIKKSKMVEPSEWGRYIKWFNKELIKFFQDGSSEQNSPESHKIEIKNVRIFSKNRVEKNSFDIKEKMIISFNYVFIKPIPNPFFSVIINDNFGTEIFSSDTKSINLNKFENKGEISIEIDFLPLKNGVYFVSILVFNHDTNFLRGFYKNKAFFNITSKTDNSSGILSINSKWTFKKI